MADMMRSDRVVHLSIQWQYHDNAKIHSKSFEFHCLRGLCFRSSLQRTYRVRLGEFLLRWLEIVWGDVEV